MIAGPGEREHSRQWELWGKGALGEVSLKCSRNRKQAGAVCVGRTPESEGNEPGTRPAGEVSTNQVIPNA